jgi:putative PIN family toxin of toxin-antitoxin system
MLRVVLDSNIYVSAFNFSGPPELILRLAEDGLFALYVSPFIVQEVSGVLKHKFGWSEADLEDTLDPILAIAQSVAPQGKLDAAEDPDDNRILECSLHVRAQILVTGDQHLLKLHPFQGISIVTARQFLDSRPWTIQADA